jgi:hypothetical protein
MGNKGQVGYPSDVSDEEWAFVAPYLAEKTLRSGRTVYGRCSTRCAGW